MSAARTIEFPVTAAGSRHGSLEGVVGAGVTHPERSSQDRRSTGDGIAHRSRFRANRNQMTPSLNRPRRSSRTSEKEFLRIADRVIARLLRVDCPSNSYKRAWTSCNRRSPIWSLSCATSGSDHDAVRDLGRLSRTLPRLRWLMLPRDAFASSPSFNTSTNDVRQAISVCRRQDECYWSARANWRADRLSARHKRIWTADTFRESTQPVASSPIPGDK
jgi:hypothetical protein